MRNHARIVGALALAGLAACGEALAVNNYNSPDVSRVLSNEASVVSLVAGLGAQLNNPQRNSESVNTQAKIMAEESFASVANFGMAARVANRTQIDNDLGNDNSASNFQNFNAYQRVQRLAFTALKAYADIKARNSGITSLSADAETQMRAFAYVIAARSIANTAVAYDSLAVLDEATGTSVIPGLLSAAAANVKAIEYFDSASTIAARGTGVGLPAAWLSQTADMSAADFQRLIRSYRARARVAIARTPAERAAVNWTAVIADATAGITADHVIQINGNTGWGAGFDAGQIYVVGGWHSVPMKYLGMADSSGAYQAWINTAPSSRRAFVVATLDNRWPTGDNRAAQQASTPNNQILPKYIRNRPTGDDVVAAGDGESFYDHRRYGATQQNTTVAGPYTELSKTEIDMLAAEGHIRAGNYAAAEPLINISRLRNGLPSVAGVGAGVVPGGNACVPKLPTGACGTLLEAMKYEKRMETAFTGYMVWFTDSRGWNDLPANTAIEWPVPFQEMQARQQPYYDGTRQQAGASTYGF